MVVNGMSNVPLGGTTVCTALVPCRDRILL